TYGWGDRNTAQIGVGTDLNIVSQRLEEHIRLLPTRGLDVSSIGVANPFLTQNLGSPVSHLVDGGVFIDGALPVGNRLTFRAGLRADWVRTTSDDRLITGSIFITPGTGTIPGIPPLPGQPLTPGETSFNPILFSVSPNDQNLVRHFGLWSAYIN